MGFIKKARNTIVIGGLGLLGTLAGTKYDSIPDVYQKVLQTEIIEKKAYMQSIKDNKKITKIKKHMSLV